jgi:GNAT superfamily N-acetyltransferase
MKDRAVGSSVEVRTYRSDDREACRALWVELTEWHRTLYRSPGIGGPEPGRQFDEHLARVGPDHIWVAETGGRLVGLAGLIADEGDAELEPLVVSEGFRGQGIGRRLAEAVIASARARGVRQLKVRPVARNEDAIRVFHRLGFDILGQIELFADFGPLDSQVWIPGWRLADRDFRA